MDIYKFIGDGSRDKDYRVSFHKMAAVIESKIKKATKQNWQIIPCESLANGVSGFIMFRIVGKKGRLREEMIRLQCPIPHFKKHEEQFVSPALLTKKFNQAIKNKWLVTRIDNPDILRIGVLITNLHDNTLYSVSYKDLYHWVKKLKEKDPVKGKQFQEDLKKS